MTTHSKRTPKYQRETLKFTVSDSGLGEHVTVAQKAMNAAKPHRGLCIPSPAEISDKKLKLVLVVHFFSLEFCY